MAVMTNIDHGFEIEEPKALIPWGISEEELKEILGGSLRHVTKGYYTITCKTLGGMKHELGFHFNPRKSGKLVELEFFRRSYADPKGSYEEFQRHFESSFGKPSSTEKGLEGFDSHKWILGNNTIVHFVFDRFGAEEHMRVKHAI